MATAQLGAFSYDMLLNIAKFEDGLTKAQRLAEQRASAIHKTIKGAVDGVSDTLKDIAGAVIAGFSIEHLIEFGKQAIETADQMGKAAQKVGLSVEAISALSVSAKFANSNLDALQGGMEKLAKNAALAASGNHQAAATFNAIGVSVKDATGNLRPMQSILDDVAKKFASYDTSIAKTALAQELFGKSGADLIPVLNEIGEKGFAGATAQAAKFGQVISTETAKQASDFNDNLSKLSLEAHGFGNAIVRELLPGLTQLTDQMAKAGETTDAYAGSAGTVATAIKGLIAGLITVKEILSGLYTVMFGFFDAIKTTFSAAGEFIGTWAEGVGKSIKAAFSLDLTGLAATQAEYRAKLANIGTDTIAKFKAIGSALSTGVGENIKNAQAAWTALFGAIDAAGASAEKTGESMKKGAAPLVPLAERTRALAEDTAAMAHFLDQLSGKFGGSYRAAINEYAATIEDARKQSIKYVSDGKSVAEVQKFIAEATQLATQRFQEQTNATTVITRFLDDVNQKYAEQNRLIGLTGTALQIETEYQRLRNESDKALLDTMGPLEEADQKRIDSLHDMAVAHVTLAENTKLSIEATKEWQSIWVTAGNGIASTFAKVLVEGGSLFDGLKNLAKQTVEAIIEYFAKLAIINPILNSIFGGGVGAGGGFSLLPTLANSAFGSGGGGGVSAGGAGGGLFSVDTWVGAGKNLYTGFASMFGGGTDLAGGGVLASYGSSAAFSGATAGGELGLSYGGGTGTIASGASYGAPGTAGGGFGLGQGLAIAGAVVAGYNEFKNAGGGVAGVAGAAAYGVGTYFATTAAATAMTAGVSAGLAAIPVVGWIALAAMLIDKFSGGKLFGTGGKVVGGNQTETISDSGASVVTNITKKGQRALFGGAYWKESPIATDPAAIKGATDFQQSLKAGTDAFAKFFKVDLVSIVGGTFQTMFDKNGKQTGTASTVGGVSFKGETAQQWAERLQAGSYLKVLDEMGLAATDFVSGLQGNADDLIAGVQDFASAAQTAFTNLGNGFTFMALGADETLPQILKFVEGLQQAGESLSDAYNRLAQAQAQYNQFVGQFKEAPTYVDPFEQSMANLYTQMIGAQHQANALAIAAGASGASLEDLTNIQKSYARQAAQLTQALEASAQTLAFSLGLTTFGSLDQINQEIANLQGRAGDASSSISDFGSTITQVAQKASDAMNLLLGDLSPLNDQQKLQKALEGLRAGTVSQEQVLQIGRRLYASSQAYNDLFAQVSQYGGANGGVTTGGSNGGHITTNGGGLSAADQERLKQLLKEQAELQAAATMQQYQTLAMQIAEIAMAKGEDWQAVLKEMGIKSADLETALGLKDDAALNDYISQLQKQTDSAKNNTASIVDAIYDLKANLLRVLGDSSPVTGEPTISGDPTQRIGSPTPIDRTRNPDGSSPLTGRRQPGSDPNAPITVELSDDSVDRLGENIGGRISGSFKGAVREHADTFMRSGR